MLLGIIVLIVIEFITGIPLAFGLLVVMVFLWAVYLATVKTIQGLVEPLAKATNEVIAAIASVQVQCPEICHGDLSSPTCAL